MLGNHEQTLKLNPNIYKRISKLNQDTDNVFGNHKRAPKFQNLSRERNSRICIFDRNDA